MPDDVPQDDLGVLLSGAIAQGVGGSIAQLVGQMPELVGTAPLLGQTERATIGGSIAQAWADAQLATWTVHSDSDVAKIWHQLGWNVLIWTMPLCTLEARTRIGGGVGMESGWLATYELLKLEAGHHINSWLKDRRATGLERDVPIWDRIGKTYLTAVGLGVASHGLSALLSTRILGSGGLNLAGMSAFIGQLAGFAPITGAVMSNFYRAYLSEPMRYKVNETFAPYLPAAMDVMRYRYKRILPGMVHPSVAPFYPMEGISGEGSPGFNFFAKIMAKWGYSAEWAKVMEDDLYTEPRHFELGIMGEDDTIPESWWWEKSRRMGYPEPDVAHMVGGIRRKISRSWSAGLINEIVRQFGNGLLSVEELKERIEDVGVNSESMQYIIDMSVCRRWGNYVDREERLAQDEFARDMIDEEELRERLELVYADENILEVEVASAMVKKYRRVYWSTERDIAREIAGTMRQLYLAGMATESEYSQALIGGGMEPAVADARLRLDSYKREQRIAREFRSYRLPKLRDEVLHGFLEPDAYASYLVAGGFPPEFVSAEVDHVTRKRDERVAGEVRSDQLPAHVRAFVLGLIGAVELQITMERAGLSPEAQTARMTPLTYEREAFAERRHQATAKEEEKRRLDAEKQATETEAHLHNAMQAVAATEAARKADRQARLDSALRSGMALTDRFAREDAERIKEEVGDLGEALAVEVRKGPAANVPKLEGLVEQFDRAYWWSRINAQIGG